MRVIQPHQSDDPKATAEPAPEDPRLASVDLQQLWFQLHRREWSSLVLVPAEPGNSAAGLTTMLGRVGTTISHSAPKVVNAERMAPAAIRELIVHLVNPPVLVSPDDQRRVLISIDSVLSNPLAIGVAQAADAVVLCVRKGRTKIAAARRTIELIGRERFVGSVVLSRGGDRSHPLKNP
jgi:hypothetical protein